MCYTRTDICDLLQVSLRINAREDNRDIPKDYLLQRQTITSENVSHLTQNTYLFTERDLPGHENRMVVFGEARSALYESMKRDMRKKERKKKWEPYVRKTVPSMYHLLLRQRRSCSHCNRTNGFGGERE